MNVISPTFEVVDFLPLFIVAGVVLLLILISRLKLKGQDRIDATVLFSLFGGVVLAVTLAGHFTTHHDNMVRDLEERFESGYELTIIDNQSTLADIPLTPGDEAEAVKVFLHEIPGEQSIIVEIVGGKYVVTHNGEVREPVN